jgi:hypothetical protein
MLLWSEAGEAYAIPLAALQAYRLSDDQRAELEAQLGAGSDDLGGFLMEPYGEAPSFGFGAMSQGQFLALAALHPRHAGVDYRLPKR